MSALFKPLKPRESLLAIEEEDEDGQLLCDYEVEIRNEIINSLDDLKKENYYFSQMVNLEESFLWDKLINQINFYNVKYPEEKLKRLTKIIKVYNSLCFTCKEICRILQDVESIKSSLVSK